MKKKTRTSQDPHAAKSNVGKFEGNKQRPEIRDNLDHREHLENNRKGNDVTHNNKQDQHKPNKKDR